MLSFDSSIHQIELPYKILCKTEEDEKLNNSLDSIQNKNINICSEPSIIQNKGDYNITSGVKIVEVDDANLLENCPKQLNRIMSP